MIGLVSFCYISDYEKTVLRNTVVEYFTSLYVRHLFNVSPPPPVPCPHMSENIVTENVTAFSIPSPIQFYTPGVYDRGDARD
jgi:hypothetical protein